MRLFLALMACTAAGCAQQSQNPTRDVDKAKRAVTLPPIDDFLCGPVQSRQYDYKLAVQYPASDTAKAWNYLGSGTVPTRCWNYSILTVGLIGTEADISGLIDYVLSPAHQRSVERFYSYARIPAAVGALVGRGGGTHQAGLNFLLDCSDEGYWAGKTDVVGAAGFSTAQAGLNLALACTEALGLTRSSAAKARLDTILQNASIHPDMNASAQTGLDDRALIQLNESALQPYFLP